METPREAPDPPLRRCTVCASECCYGEHFANSWERSLGRNPCCSEGCAKLHDPDVHWMPPEAPPLLSDDEHDRLVAVARKRVTTGDNPVTVVREMLQAGMPTASLRKVVFFSAVGAADAQAKAREVGVFGLILGALTGFFLFARREDPRDQEQHRRARDDLDAWERRFGGSA
jgi:hypothetical protein